MQLLALNAGSSSARLSLFDVRAQKPVLVRGVRLASPEAPKRALREFLGGGADAIGAVAHRIVHGGERLAAPVLLDEEVERAIERVSPLAPAHNPVALAWLRASRALAPGVPQVAVFDTGFYAGLPEAARHYALPEELAARHGLRRYGFHGLAHQAMWQRWCALRPDLPRGGRVISFQLGAGCSATAIARGRPLETSMGFSPLEGLMMATRSGDIDPSVAFHLQRDEGLSAEETERLLNQGCGLLGVAGDADMRRVLARGDQPAGLALDMYCHRARKYLGAYLAVLCGTDAVLFGGGVGENAPAVRARILHGMEWAGIALDAKANQAAIGTEARISAPNAGTQAWVIPVDEASLLAEQALQLLAPAPAKHEGSQ